MKLRLLSILSLIAGSVFFTSCNIDDDVNNLNVHAPVQFSAQTDNAQPSNTNGNNQWLAGNKIGIFMIKNGQSLSTANIVDGADNIAYQLQTENNQSSFMPIDGNTIFYPQNGDKVDFIAYCPHKPTGSTMWDINNYTYVIDVSNQTVPSNIDALYSNTKDKNKNSGVIDFQFRHVLSKLSFKIIIGDGAPNLEGADFAISNINMTANLNLIDGSINNIGSPGTIVANSSTYSAILIPQTLNNSQLDIRLANNAGILSWRFPDTTTFEAGKDHIYTITANKTGITVSTSNITDWTGKDDNPTTGTAHKVYKVGDYYPDPSAVYQNGTLISGTAAIGVVFWLDNQNIGDHPYSKFSEHGKIIGLYELGFNTLNATLLMNYGTKYNAGTGWYMPAYGEHDYQDLYCSYNGMIYENWNTIPKDRSNNSDSRAWFNTKLTNAGGNGIAEAWHWITSDNGANQAYLIHFSDGYVQIFNTIQSANKSRAIKRF